MKDFLTYFPKSTVVIADFDIDGKKANRTKTKDVSFDELKEFNDEKKAIFITTCDTKTTGWEKGDFKDIRAWFCDLDMLTREEEDSVELSDEWREKEIEIRKVNALAKLGKAVGEGRLFPPSFVIEGRNGFHVYWLAWHETMMDATYSPGGGLYKPSKDNFDWIEQNIVEILDGDEKACKLVQLMRVPGFYNWKRGGKSLVKLCNLFDSLENGERRMYTDDEWIGLFGEKKEPFIEYNALPSIFAPSKRRKTNCVFEYVKNLKQDEALMRLSGSSLVDGEVYELVDVAGGRKKNIKINGKLCSSFVDLEKNCVFVREGSGRGAPNVIEWIKYYHPEYIDEPSLLAVELRKIFNFTK